MPLTLNELENIQADCLADDVAIDFEKMSVWDETTVREYFENGGQLPAVEEILTTTKQQPLQCELLPLAKHTLSITADAVLWESLSGPRSMGNVALCDLLGCSVSGDETASPKLVLHGFPRRKAGCVPCGGESKQRLTLTLTLTLTPTLTLTLTLTLNLTLTLTVTLTLTLSLTLSLTLTVTLPLTLILTLTLTLTRRRCQARCSRATRWRDQRAARWPRHRCATPRSRRLG